MISKFGRVVLALLCLSVPALVSAQDLLGVFQTGDRIEVSIGRVALPHVLTVLIDGKEVETGWEIVGGQLRLILPEGLSGQRHDLVLQFDKPGQTETIGAWVFDTKTLTRELYVSLTTEAGYAGSNTRADGYTSAAGRIDFSQANGRFTGAISFGYPDSAGQPVSAELSINDLFVQYRGRLGGDELYTRLGTHYIHNDTGLLDDATRRGLSFRLEDLSDTYQLAAFALTPSVLESKTNLSGLEDPNDLVYGAYGYMQPFEGGSTRVSFAGYSGRSAASPDGSAGTGAGYGITLSGPFGRGQVNYALGFEQSRWETADSSNTGQALVASLDYEVLSESEGALGLSLDLHAIDQGHYSFLNPLRIAGELGAKIELAYISPLWQWQAALGYAETNYHGSAEAPTDALGALSLKVFYLPDDFTGGFQNGTTFYALADVLTQDRLVTPARAIDPQDNTFYSFIIGFDKFNQNTSYALSYRYDLTDDHSTSDDDELSRRVDFMYTVSPNSALDIKFSAEAGHLINADGAYWDAGASLAVNYELIPDVLTSETEFGFHEYENPAEVDGLYASQKMLLQVASGHNLVLSAYYGNGSQAHDLVDSPEGWVFGIALRSEFGFSLNR